MKSLPALLLSAFSFSALSLTTDLGKLQFGGYLENKATVNISPNEIISDVAQTRIEGYWDFGKYGGIESHVILTAPLQPLDPFETLREGSVTDVLFKQLLSPYMEALGEFQSSAELLPVSETTINRLIKYLPYSTFYPSDKVILDRALVKAYFKYFDLFIGRQMIAWGTGYAFNPTDVWNSKSPLDPDAPKVGVTALRLEIPLGSLSRISIVASPGRNIDNSSGGIRYKTHIAGFDFSFSGIRLMNADRQILGLPAKMIYGADLAGQIGEVGVWAEVALNNPIYSGMEYTDFDSCYLQADIGVDYTFTNGLYAMAEYYFNQSGKKKATDYITVDLINVLVGDMSGLARHYLFAGLRYAAVDRFTFSAFTLSNLVDHSVMLIPSVEYSLSDNISLELGAQIGVGDKEKSEYGGVTPNIYLKTTGYF